ncbi:MAG: DcaP family trimeric outer membrane transporter [Rikenellaceae bacterium]
MKKFTLHTILLLMTINFVSSALYSQERISALFFKDDSVNIEIISILRDTRNVAFQDPGNPFFTLVDKSQKFALGVGGQIRLVAGSEFGGIIESTTNQGFQPSLIPIPSGVNPKSQLRLSAATSQFFIKMVGRTRKLGDVETFISMNFQGDNYAPVLRQAYVKFCGFEFGQTWSSLTDVSGFPPTIDYAGPVSIVAVRNPLIRYSTTSRNSKNTVALSLEFPQVNATYSDYTQSTYQAIPDVIGYYQFNWGEKKDNHIRFSGIMRNMAYSDLENYSTRNEQGWGAQFTSVFNLNQYFKFYGQAILGQGIASYMTDISTQNVDLVPNINSAGALDKMEMWGAYAGLQCNITKNVFTSATYSYSRIYDNNNIEVTSDMYKFSQYIVANAFWNITKECTLGIEYLRGMKNIFSGEMGHSNRANFMVQYSF